MPNSVAKKVDKKGRVLIPELADSMVLIEKVAEGEFLVKAAEVIPARESWLYKNKKVKSMVERGLQDAKLGKLVNRKFNKEDYSWVSELED